MHGALSNRGASPYLVRSLQPAGMVGDRDIQTRDSGMTHAHLAAIPWRADVAATAAVLAAAVLDNVPHVRRCRIGSEGPGLARFEIAPRWYAYLTLGVLHFLIWRRVHSLAAYVAPAGVRVRVRVL